MENVIGVAAVDLRGRFQEKPFVRDQSCDGKTGVIDAVFAGYQVIGDNRTIRPGQHVIVQRIHLSKRSPHLSDFYQQPARKGWKSQVTLLESHSLFAKRNKE